MKSNSKGLPNEIKSKKVGKKEGSSLAFQKGKSTLSALDWREKEMRKPVWMIAANVDPEATQTHVARKQKDGGRKNIPCPLPIEKYNLNMNAVDEI